MTIAESISPCKETTVPVDVVKEDTSKVVLDVTKLKATGFQYEVGFEEGLKRIIKERNK